MNFKCAHYERFLKHLKKIITIFKCNTEQLSCFNESINHKQKSKPYTYIHNVYITKKHKSVSNILIYRLIDYDYLQKTFAVNIFFLLILKVVNEWHVVCVFCFCLRCVCVYNKG